MFKKNYEEEIENKNNSNCWRFSWGNLWPYRIWSKMVVCSRFSLCLVCFGVTSLCVRVVSWFVCSVEAHGVTAHITLIVVFPFNVWRVIFLRAFFHAHLHWKCDYFVGLFRDIFPIFFEILPEFDGIQSKAQLWFTFCFARVNIYFTTRLKNNVCHQLVSFYQTVLFIHQVSSFWTRQV